MQRIDPHVQEDISRAKAHIFFARLGWVANDLHKDYGEDMLVTIFKDGLTTPISFLVQLKSTRKAAALHSKRTKSFGVRIGNRLLGKWQDSVIATFLLLYNEREDYFVWDYVQHLTRDWKRRSSGTATLRIGDARRLTPECADEMASYAQHRLEGYQRMIKCQSDLEESLRQHYGIDAKLGLHVDNAWFPDGVFSPAEDGAQIVFPLGDLLRHAEQVSRKHPKCTLELAVNIGFRIIKGMFKSLEAGKPATLHFSGCEVQFDSTEQLRDWVQRRSKSELSFR